MSTLEKTIQGREAIVALAIMGLITIAATFVSCGTGHVSCDAYGQAEYQDINVSK
jgi:hypothetical protein